MKKNRDSFLIKNRENLTKFYQKFCFFQKFKFIHFTEALEKFYNFLSMTIIVFDVLNNELCWNSLKNYKLREIFENISLVFSLSWFFLPPFFSFQPPFGMNKPIAIARSFRWFGFELDNNVLENCKYDFKACLSLWECIVLGHSVRKQKKRMLSKKPTTVIVTVALYIYTVYIYT